MIARRSSNTRSRVTEGLPKHGPLRVLMVVYQTVPAMGGVEYHVEQVTRRLAAEGVDITVLATDRDGVLPADECRDGVRIKRVRAWPRERDYFFAPEIYPQVRKSCADVVHVQTYNSFVSPIAMLAAARSRLPYVVTFHAGGHSSRIRQAIRPLQLSLLRPLLARADRLLALAEFEIEHYARRLRIPADRFVVVPNGSDLPPAPRIPRDPSLIASLGRLERCKGHHRVIKVLPAILEKRPDVRLWIGGAGPYEDELRKLADDLAVSDRVVIRAIPVGDRERMAEELSRVKVVVSLSDFETQPISVLEAANLGCRLVVADVPGLRNLADEGIARRVPLTASPAETAAAVCDELQEPPAPQAHLPTWDDCAHALLEVYTDVMSKTRMRVESRGR
jgi:glycosyltransferase involved in cell wall biosynthesis